jgi:hypothetical protein
MNGIFESVEISKDNILHKDIDIMVPIDNVDTICSIKQLKLVNDEFIIVCTDKEKYFNNYLFANKGVLSYHTIKGNDFIHYGHNLYKNYYKLMITIGDWSEDGHCKSERYGLISNYDVETIQEAYKKSCKLTQISFCRVDEFDFGGNNDEDWRYICVEYGDDKIEPMAIAILNQYNLLKSLNIDSTNELYHPSIFASLIMQFISLSMPMDFRWKFSKINLDEAKAINGWWNTNLNVQFGYGLFQ